VVAAALALWLFGGLTQDVVANDDAALRDPGITSWIVAHRVAWLTGVMRSVTWAGSVVVLIPLALAVGLTVLRSARTARPLIQLAAALGASILLYNVVRALVDRPRPPIADRLVRVSGPSFPSGHSADSAAVYVMLALLLLASGHDGRRLAIAAALLVMPVVVASSRLYLGVHWFTDVLAGLALGCAIVAVVIAVTMLLPPRRGEPPGGDRPSPVPDRVGAGGEG